MQQVIFDHVEVTGLGGERAVAAVGAPLVIGLPVALEHPRARGHLSLASADPRVPPLIHLNYASDPQDLRRLVEGVRLARRIAHQPEIEHHVTRVALLARRHSARRSARVVRSCNRRDPFRPAAPRGWGPRAIQPQ